MLIGAVSGWLVSLLFRGYGFGLVASAVAGILRAVCRYSDTPCRSPETCGFPHGADGTASLAAAPPDEPMDPVMIPPITPGVTSVFTHLAWRRSTLPCRFRQSVRAPSVTG